MGIVIAPHIAREFPGRSVDPWNITASAAVLSASTETPDTDTKITKDRGNIIEYSVAEGDTVSSIADKFGVSADTIRWQNSITGDKIKVGQTIEILPVTGIAHKVQKGDTLSSIAKRYDVDPQEIVNFPFNTFVDDEDLEQLAIGQILIVPNGVKPPDNFLAGPITPRAKQLTPNAGTVSATGSLIWPTAGAITQRFAWYHPGIDVANPAAPSILAADSGKIIVAGWVDNSGYGNRIIIDHGNGMRTLYGHLSQISVVVGQTVKRGDVIGRMGSTGRSTGTHLHFEVHMPGGRINPLSILR